MSIVQRCLNVEFSLIHTEVSSVQRCFCSKGVLVPEVSSVQRCFCSKGVLVPEMSSVQRCFCSKGVLVPEVSSVQRYPRPRDVLHADIPGRNVFNAELNCTVLYCNKLSICL